MRSRTKRANAPGVAATLLWLTTVLSGCAREDTDRLARIGRKTMDRCEALTANLRGKVEAGVEAVRVSLPEPPPAPAAGPKSQPAAAPLPAVAPPAAVAAIPLDARVLWRIRWDKALAGADVQVDSPGNGVVQLRGIVNDLGRQRRAVELAETTEGVEKVVSELGLKQP